VLLLDEPANGLDPEGIHWVRNLLRWLADQGKAILVSSHLLGEVARLADEVIVIRRGRFVTQGSLAELTGSSRGVLRVASLDDGALGSALEARGGEVAVTPEGLHVTGVAAEEVGRVSIEVGVPLRELAPVVAELEDVFMELTTGGGIA
jgi:ABC-2 type transport system ATP-binding protein